jgi:anaerobic selenocysteine-containing dehydrogenase
MTMSEWKKTGCALCAQNCGLELLVENNRIVKVRGDKSNPRSQGYVCRKGMNIAYFQHHDQRLKYPLKKVNGEFVRISWEQAITEISARLREIKDKYGPRSIAYMGEGDNPATSRPLLAYACCGVWVPAIIIVPWLKN